MRKLLLAALFLVVAVAPVRADEIFLGDLQVVDQFPLDAPRTTGTAVLTPDYSNVTNFLGNGFVNAGSALQGTNRITRLVADDITPTGAHAGLSVTQFVFSIANFNATAVTVRPRVRFWFTDGTGGAPGTYYNLPAAVGFSFNPLTIGPGVTLLSANLAPNQFAMPGVPFWAGITFDDNAGTTGISAAQLDLVGQGIFAPPTLGTSNDQFFITQAAGSFFGLANPAGSLSNFGANPVADFGWEFSVDVPVPTKDSSWGRVKAQYRN